MADDILKTFNEIFTPSYFDSKGTYDSKIGSAESLSKILKTDLRKGIDASDKNSMSWRLTTFGNNHFIPEEPLRFFDFIKECFEDIMLKSLLLSAIVSLLIGILKDGIATGWIEGAAIFAAVFIVVGISSTLNYNERLQYRKLAADNKKKNVIVIRNGVEKDIDSEALTVGDILLIKPGDIIDVDGFLITDALVKVDESSITGEQNLAKKTPQFIAESTPIIISGTKIQSGKGEMIVCSVGENTYSQKMRRVLYEKEDNEDEKELTPLQLQLKSLADNINIFGLVMGILIGSVMIIREVIIRVKNQQTLFDYEMLDIIVNAFILAITVIVVAIPEGLPMAVSIALAYSLNKLKQKHNLVKTLISSETMGNVNNVCTDKTGTLTLGEMAVGSLWISEQNIDADVVAKVKELPAKDKDTILFNILHNVSVVKSKDINDKPVLHGDMTEKALYKFIASTFGDKVDSFKEKPVYVLPFSSEYKFMMSVYKNADSSYTLYAKGAYEKLKEYILSTSVNKDKIESILNDYAGEAKRTIIFASKKVDKETFESNEKSFKEKDIKFFQSICNDLVFNFVIGICDPIRKEVPQSIEQCKRAGITVRMITGDNLLTALSISKNAGILTEDEVKEAKKSSAKIKELIQKNASITPDKLESPLAIEGDDFRKLTQGSASTIGKSQLNMPILEKLVKNLKVIARASPEDKFNLVSGLKELNNIIAVTGDGTNDAPALKQAHVGFAMGIRGTDIAKEAADIILLDDSFQSIITACKFGRNVYDCIRKFIQFQLTTNIVAVFMTLLAGFVIEDSPLNCIEMLWVNLIMDSFASLALATESPSDSLLDRKPYKREDSILTSMMKFNVIGQALYQVVVLIVILFYGEKIFNVPSDRELEHYEWDSVHGYHFTIFFNVFVFMQVFNSINARKLRSDEINVFKGIFDNAYYIFVQTFIVVGQVLIVTFGGKAVRTRRLSLAQHLQCALVGSLSLVVGVVTKVVYNVLKEKKERKIK